MAADIEGSIAKTKITITYNIIPPPDRCSEPLLGDNLEGCNLSGFDLSGAALTFANLNAAILAGATLTDALWEGTVCPDGVLSSGLNNGCAGHLGF